MASVKWQVQQMRLALAAVRGLPGNLGHLHQLLASQYILSALNEPALRDPRRLERFGSKGYSQFDEDGVLQEIFRRVGVTNRRFLEIGTGDGRENNTVYLLCQGWGGVWIEADLGHHEIQRRAFKPAVDSSRLRPVHGFATRDNINELIEDTGGLQGPIDLLSIDIDGNDYHLLEAITVVAPRVIVIEYNAYIPPPVLWVMEYNPSHIYDEGSTYFGASLKSLELLGRKKGYTLVGCNLVGLNAFFVRTDLAGDLFAEEGQAERLFQPRRYWLDRAYRTLQAPFLRPFVEQ
jgi:hypothetical protein